MNWFKSVTVAWAVLLAVGLSSGWAYAAGSTVELETAVEAAPRERIITLGLGAAAVPDYEGSENYRAVPVPLFKLIDPSGWYVELLGNTLRANLLPSPTWRVGPMARYRAERDDVDNNRVDRMRDVDAAFELGGFFGFEYNNWSLKVEAAADVADGHDGVLVGLTGGYTWPLERWRITLSGFTTYADDEYMSAYFDVDSRDSARSGLKTFDADAGFKDAGATLVGAYRFAERWGLTAGARYTRLLGDAADSPVVDDEGSEDQFLAALLVSYTF